MLLSCPPPFDAAASFGGAEVRKASQPRGTIRRARVCVRAPTNAFTPDRSMTTEAGPHTDGRRNASKQSFNISRTGDKINLVFDEKRVLRRIGDVFHKRKDREAVTATRVRTGGIRADRIPANRNVSEHHVSENICQGTGNHKSHAAQYPAESRAASIRSRKSCTASTVLPMISCSSGVVSML